MIILALPNIGNGSGSDEGPADCVGLRDGPRDGMFALDGTELVEGPKVGMGNMINDGAGLDPGPIVRTGDGPEMA